MRRVADEVGTTAPAVYSLFGSKDGLLVTLGTRAFEMLGAAVAALPESDEPASDLVHVATVVFRRFAISHPILFGIGFQRNLVAPELASQFDAARLRAPPPTGGQAGPAGAGRPTRRPSRRGGIWQDAVRSSVAGFATVASA